LIYIENIHKFGKVATTKLQYTHLVRSVFGSLRSYVKIFINDWLSERIGIFAVCALEQDETRPRWCCLRFFRKSSWGAPTLSKR
jgi:hypothetical protein